MTKRQAMDCLWTAYDVAGYVNVARATVYEWVNQERIPYLRINGVLRFDPAEIQSWMREAARVTPDKETQNGCKKVERKVVHRRLGGCARTRKATVSKEVTREQREGGEGVRGGVREGPLVDIDALYGKEVQ